MGTFRVVCASWWWRVLGGEQEFVKTFTSWQLVASWWVLDGLPSGAGGYVLKKITPCPVLK